MTLSDRDLSQMDTDYLDDLPEGDLRSLSKRLLTDLKEARERLKQSPETSSRPPSSREPWKASQPGDDLSEESPATVELPAADTTTPSADEPVNQVSATPPPGATGMVVSKLVKVQPLPCEKGRCRRRQGCPKKLGIATQGGLR